MELEKQVTDLALSKRLKELNCRQESLWWWNAHDRIDEETNTCYKDNFKLENHNHWGNICGGYESISAYTTSELGEMLKDYISLRETYTNKIGWRIHAEKYAHFCTADTEVNARGLMLKWLIENKKIVV